MLTLERPGAPPPSGPGDDDGDGWHGGGTPGDGQQPMWPVIAVALGLITAVIALSLALSLVLPHGPPCQAGSSAMGKPHPVRICP